MRFRLRRSLLLAAAAVARRAGSRRLRRLAQHLRQHPADGDGDTHTVTQPRAPVDDAPRTDTGPQTDTTATKTSTTAARRALHGLRSDAVVSRLQRRRRHDRARLRAEEHRLDAPVTPMAGPASSSCPRAARRCRPTRPAPPATCVGSTPAGVLTLRPGEEASFRMVTSDMGPNGSSCPTASALQIYAPDDTVTMKVALDGVAACGKATLSPMMPGDSAFAGQGGGGGGPAGIGSGGSGWLGGSGGSARTPPAAVRLQAARLGGGEEADAVGLASRAPSRRRAAGRGARAPRRASGTPA